VIATGRKVSTDGRKRFDRWGGAHCRYLVAARLQGNGGFRADNVPRCCQPPPILIGYEPAVWPTGNTAHTYVAYKGKSVGCVPVGFF
jgi:hypothetical protein